MVSNLFLFKKVFTNIFIVIETMENLPFNLEIEIKVTSNHKKNEIYFNSDFLFLVWNHEERKLAVHFDLWFLFENKKAKPWESQL